MFRRNCENRNRFFMYSYCGGARSAPTIPRPKAKVFREAEKILKTGVFFEAENGRKRARFLCDLGPFSGFPSGFPGYFPGKVRIFAGFPGIFQEKCGLWRVFQDFPGIFLFSSWALHSHTGNSGSGARDLAIIFHGKSISPGFWPGFRVF